MVFAIGEQRYDYESNSIMFFCVSLYERKNIKIQNLQVIWNLELNMFSQWGLEYANCIPHKGLRLLLT